MTIAQRALKGIVAFLLLAAPPALAQTATATSPYSIGTTSKLTGGNSITLKNGSTTPALGNGTASGAGAGAAVGTGTGVGTTTVTPTGSSSDTATVVAPGSVTSAISGAGPLVVEAQSVVAQMQSLTGVPIVILTRDDGDLTGFYTAAMQSLCSATGTGWCDTDLYTVLTDTTNPMGWARVLTYVSDAGATQTVCTILPPSTTVSATYVASGISGGTVFDWRDLTTDDEAQSWLLMEYAGICQGTTGDATEEKAADAFASLSLTLMEGNGVFVAARDVSPARKFSFYRNQPVNAWAVNTGERILYELWKAQAAQVLSSGGCNATAVPSTNLDTPDISRDSALPAGGDCNATSQGKPQGSVTDSNLWLWTYGASGLSASWPTVDLPPAPYTPFMTFGSLSAGVSYAWSTASSLSQQY